MIKLDSEMHVILPPNVENLSLPSPSLVTYYKNLERRILWLDEEVDDSYYEFIRYIIDWNIEDMGVAIKDRRPITLMINTMGGDLSVCNAMIDTIKMSKTPIRSVNMGCCFSAGSFIFLACKERYVLPRSTFLIHKGSGEFQGTYDEIIASIGEYTRQIEELVAYLHENTKIPDEEIEEHISSEWYVNAEKSIEWGIATKILTDFDKLFAKSR